MVGSAISLSAADKGEINGKRNTNFTRVIKKIKAVDVG
jgi:hypothetical protein